MFAGAGLDTGQNAEYRSVLATLDTTVLEVTGIRKGLKKALKRLVNCTEIC